MANETGVGGTAGGLDAGASATSAALHSLLSKLDAIEKRLDRIEAQHGSGAGLLPPGESPASLMATITDAADDLQRRLAARGVDLDDRGRRLLALLERLTHPETLAALTQGLQALRELPGLVGMTADALDDAARCAAQQGLDVDRGLRNGLWAALRLAQRFGETEVDRLTEFLDSDVLHPAALRTVGDAGCALAEARSAAPPRVGLFGLLSALRDPAVQTSLGFAIRFAQTFGQTVTQPAARK